MRRAILACTALLMLLIACNQESTVGADLLGDETIEVQFTDTIELEAVTKTNASVTTFINRSNFNNRTYLIGSIDDPVFGKSTSTTYITPTYPVTPRFPEIAILDSVVMSLPLDTFGLYGDPEYLHTIDLFQLTDAFTVDSDVDTLKSDMCDLQFDDTPLATLESKVDERQDIKIYNPTVDSAITVSPQIRFRLDDNNALWDQLAMDTSKHSSNDSLINFLKGFALQSRDAQNSMFGIRLNEEAPAYIEWYYQDTSAQAQLYLMNLGRVRHSCFTHDYSTTEVEQAIDMPNTEKTFLQSMSGVTTEYDLSNVLDVNGNLINSAVIEIFAEDSADEFGPVENIIVSYTDENGSELVIADLLTGQAVGDVTLFFGGALGSSVVNGTTVRKYDFKLTSHIINLVRGVVTNPKIKISAFLKEQRPTRSVLYSPTHPVYPAKLKLILTNP